MKNIKLNISILLSGFVLLGMMACQSSEKRPTKNTLGKNDQARNINDALFISHESIAKEVTRQVWKEIVLGEYNVKDLKMFNLGEQTSKPGEKNLYQIISYAYQIQNDPEIFRVSLRCDFDGNQLTYQLNEEEYYRCSEKEYDPNLFAIEMKTKVSILMADDFLKRKILELNR